MKTGQENRWGNMVSQNISRTDIAEIHEAIAQKQQSQGGGCEDKHQHGLRAKIIRSIETRQFVHTKPWSVKP